MRPRVIVRRLSAAGMRFAICLQGWGRSASKAGEEMNRRLIGWGLAGGGVLALAGFGAWIFSLPPQPAKVGAPAIDRREADAIIDALKPPKRQRPVIAVVGINDATETTDYLLPIGVLRRADVADVIGLATGPGPIAMFPALAVEPDATIAAFDARYPDGADFVIVPAMSRDDDPAALEWIRRQADTGAIVVGVCAGAKVVGAAGLLDGRNATTHWYFVPELRRDHPTAVYVADRRIVVEQGVATTTGITASMPMALMLVEAIAGRARAEAVARDLGLDRWDAQHDSSAFTMTRPFALAVIGNVMAFWRREQLGIPLSPGIDEVSLALVADAWSRTYRSRALTFADGTGAVESRHGVRFIPDRTAADWPAEQVLRGVTEQPPAAALNATLAAIDARYGERTATLVAMQLEYPQPVR